MNSKSQKINFGGPVFLPLFFSKFPWVEVSCSSQLCTISAWASCMVLYRRVYNKNDKNIQKSLQIRKSTCILVQFRHPSTRVSLQYSCSASNEVTKQLLTAKKTKITIIPCALATEFLYSLTAVCIHYHSNMADEISFVVFVL